MTTPKRVLAFELLKTKCRGVIGIVSEGKIELEEIHKFKNEGIPVGDKIYWDTVKLFTEVKDSISIALQFGKIESIGITAWGMEFGLLDKYNGICLNPVEFNSKNNNDFDKNVLMCDSMTPYKLLDLKNIRSKVYEKASQLLFISDLFNCFLTGALVTEPTIASTSGLLDIGSMLWNEKILDTFALNKNLFPKIIPTGTKISPVHSEVLYPNEVSMIDVIAVCGDAFGCAEMAIPTEEKNSFYIDCELFSKLGVEIEKCETSVARENNLDLQVGYSERKLLNKCSMGLFVIQEALRDFGKEKYTYAILEEKAILAKPFKCYIDIDDENYTNQGSIIQKVKDYCERTNQFIPETVGEIMRCIYQSVAMKYNYIFQKIQKVTGMHYNEINLVGKGTKDKFLCQLIANSCHNNVIAGPIDAAIMGNISTQFITLGILKDMDNARKTVMNSQRLIHFIPSKSEEWTAAFETYLNVLGLV